MTAAERKGTLAGLKVIADEGGRHAARCQTWLALLR
jgi:hypothetical protein